MFLITPTGVASALMAQFSFLAKSALKMRCTKFFLPDKSCYKLKSATFMYVLSFDILHHYRVTVASQICSVSRKYCAVLRNRFFTFSISIALVQKIDLEILMNLHVLRHADSKKLIFGMSSVCLCVCVCVCLSVCLSVGVSVCGHHNSQKIELAQPNLVCDLI